MSRPIRKIVLVQPRQPLPSIIPSELIVMPRYGVPLIATILKNAGYDVTLFVEEIRPINWEILYEADVVMFHALSSAVGGMEHIVKRLRMRSAAPVIVGGEHVSYLPNSVLRFADYTVHQEGDETIVDLVDALSNGRDVATVKGISFRRDGRIVRTPERPCVKNFDTIVDIKTIYGWEEAYVSKNGPPYPMMTVQGTRGCPFGCKFCPVQVMLGKGYRKRSVDSIIADLADKLQYSRAVMFVDNLFEGDINHATEILERIIAEKLRPHLTIFCRSSIGKKPEMLKLMRRAGVIRIFTGIESLNQESLDNCDKGQTVADIKTAVDAIRDAGITVHATMVMGFDTDTVETIHATRDMLRQWGISQLNVFSLWGLYKHGGEQLTPLDRIIFKDWDYLNGSYVCHFPLRMRPSQLQHEIVATHDDTFDPHQEPGDYPRWSGPEEPWRDFYERIWAPMRKSMLEYIPYLEEVERGYYDENDHLLVDKMASRPDLDWVLWHLESFHTTAATRTSVTSLA